MGSKAGPAVVATTHALTRYRERVANVTAEQAAAAMSTPFIAKAAEFGARYVRLATGHRLVIVDGCIVTVLPKEHSPGSMGRERERRVYG